MTFFNTEMHLVTFIFVLAEIGLLFFQLFYIAFKPTERKRIYFIIVLLLLISYNITSSTYPNPNLDIDIQVQNVFTYCNALLLPCYFPFYFYKVWRLSSLKFDAYYGIWIFLFSPFLIYVGAQYLLFGQITFPIEYGIVIPFIYAIIVMRKMYLQIRLHYNKDNGMWTPDVYLTYFAIVPWIALPMVNYYIKSEFSEAMFINLGFICITFQFCKNNITKAWEDERKLASLTGNLSLLDTSADIFLNNCQYYNLTPREIEIVSLIRLGNSYKSTADDLFISEGTVKKHVQNIYRKVKVCNKINLIKKLEDAQPVNEI